MASSRLDRDNPIDGIGTRGRRVSALGLALIVASLAGLPIPAPAEGKQIYRGKTGQRLNVKVRTGDLGVVKHVRIRARLRCRDFTVKGWSVFFPPFDRATPTWFRDSDKTADSNRGIRVESRDRIRGWFTNDSKRRMKGRYSLTVNVFRSGRKIDRCTARTRWRASLAG